MKNKIFCYSTLLFILALSCNSSTTKTKSFKNTSSALDTIKAMGVKDKNTACTKVLNHYHKKFGVLISDYYTALDSLSIDLNRDNYPDKIVILSPISLEREDNVCPGDSLSKRLLVEIIKANGKSKVRNIYPNLISDTGGILSRYNRISKKGDGFEIVHEAGAKYSWSYKTEFSIGKNNISLSRISKTCSINGEGKTVVYRLNSLSPDKINITDTLKVDCNCDRLWQVLEND